MLVTFRNFRRNKCFSVANSAKMGLRIWIAVILRRRKEKKERYRKNWSSPDSMLASCWSLTSKRVHFVSHSLFVSFQNPFTPAILSRLIILQMKFPSIHLTRIHCIASWWMQGAIEKFTPACFLMTVSKINIVSSGKLINKIQTLICGIFLDCFCANQVELFMCKRSFAHPVENATSFFFSHLKGKSQGKR